MNNEPHFFYETEIEWKKNREGELPSPNLPPLRVSAPPEFRGQGGIWTPEPLFVASVNVCFMTTFVAIAELSKLQFTGFSSLANGKLEKVEGVGLQMTEIVIKPKVILQSGRDFERTSRILEKAEKNCPISQSVKTLIKLEPELCSQQNPT